MVLFKLKSSFLTVASAISIFSIFTPLPCNAASSLAAWEIKENGVLHLRTSAGSNLKAFFQSKTNDIGDRVWIDFPGELSRPRSIEGNGGIREIRLGKPEEGKTRLVIEFKKNVKINPKDLILKGTSPNLWQLELSELPIKGFKRIGEGIFFRNRPRRSVFSKPIKVDPSALPNVPRGKFLVVLDPGHGGPDPGAVGINGLSETDIVLGVSLKTSELLRAKGVKVILTRTRDVNLELRPRVIKANNSSANVFVSIHANATRGYRKEVNGIETYYYSGFRGMKLARKIQKELLYVAPTSPDRGVRKARFFVIKHTKMPAALVELGFVTGDLDSQRMSNAKHRDTLAFAIARGILNYLKDLS